MDGIDPCAVLGVSASATAEDIKRAYRARLLATHPDRGGKREDAEAVIAAFRHLARRRPNPFAPRTTPEPTRVVYDSPVRRHRPRRQTFAEVLAEVQAGSHR
jgi:hypothetical protein